MVAVAFFVPSSFALAGVFGVVGAVGWGVSGSLTVFFEGGVPGVCAVEGESCADFWYTASSLGDPLAAVQGPVFSSEASPS